MTEKFPVLPIETLTLHQKGGAVEVKVEMPGGTPIQPRRLRLTVASTIFDEFIVGVHDASGAQLSRFVVRYPAAGQMYEADLPPAGMAAEAKVFLKLEQGGQPLTLFSHTHNAEMAWFTPRWVTSTGMPGESVRNRMRSAAVLTEFNWMAGNVLDGILGGLFPAEEAHKIALAYLGRYLDLDGVSPESPGRCPKFGVEDTAPFAALARVMPGHPWVDRVLAFWDRQRDADGSVQELGRVVAEGNYTVAYPMAVIARVRGDAALATAACRQLRIRKKRLVGERGIWLRAAHGTQPATFLNWARGVAWYFLGLVATLRELQLGGYATDGMEGEAGRCAKWICSVQRANGLWGGFLHEAATADETSGSAGLGAGLAIGARAGLIDRACRENAARAATGLESHLTPDGFMGGASQRNTAGEEFQRSDYRILSPYALGMYAWLLGSL